jgi:TonB family protein
MNEERISKTAADTDWNVESEMFQDRGISKRLVFGGAASLTVNACLWAALATGANHVAATPPPAYITVERVQLTSDPKRPEIIKPKIILPKPKPIAPQKERRPLSKPPEGSHSQVLTVPAKSGTPKPSDFTALAGGNAKLGAPVESQQPGNSPTPAPAPPPPVEQKHAVTQPTPAPVTPQPAPPAPVTKTVDAPPPPPPPPPPKAKGPTQDAQPDHTVQPEIPDELKSEQFKSFVRVRVEIAADGSFQVILRTSSGNQEVDKRVLEALKKWTWKPALKDGDPVDSIQLFKFQFQVE